jgi:flagellar biosynthetic protein FliR
MIDTILREFPKYFPEINNALGAGIFIFARLAGFMRFAPVFNRKEIPALIKIGLIFILSVILTLTLKPAAAPQGSSLFLGLVLNITAGAIIGYIAQCITAAIMAAGDMINMQMGLSSATILDPTSQGQTSILGNAFSILAIIIFMHVGGVYWMLNAFMRSFEIFPMYQTTIPLAGLLNLDYIIKLTSNVLYVGLQIASPVLLATLGQDLILGIISKTAPQVNVFQLSFLFKPVLGAAILIWIMPIIFNVISDYFLSFARIF